MVEWFFLSLANAACAGLNICVGIAFGFGPLTVLCIILNTMMTLWCLIKSATAS